VVMIMCAVLRNLGGVPGVSPRIVWLSHGEMSKG